MIALLLGAALAAPPTAPERPISLVAGFGGTAGLAPGSGGGQGMGRLLVNFGSVSLDAGAREGFHSPEPRLVGNVGFGVRGWLPGGWIRGGFAHNHEIGVDAFLDDPVGGLFGVARGIDHRTGLEAAAGLHRPLQALPELELFAEASAMVFPDDRGPVVYALLEVGAWVSVGRWPSR